MRQGSPELLVRCCRSVFLYLLHVGVANVLPSGVDEQALAVLEEQGRATASALSELAGQGGKLRSPPFLFAYHSDARKGKRLTNLRPSQCRGRALRGER